MSSDKDYSSKLCVAVSTGNFGAVNSLLKEGSPHRNCPSISVAVENGDLDILLALLPFFDVSRNSNHVLSRAAVRGDQGMVDILLPLSTAQDPYCRALIYAAQRGHLNIVRTLIPFSSPNIQEEAFLSAASHGQLDILDAFLDGLPFLKDDVSEAYFKASVNAVGINALNVFERLAEYYVYQEHHQEKLETAFLEAAGRGILHGVKDISKYIDPKINNSKALAWASFSDNIKVFDYLYPLSDPDSALIVLEDTINARDQLFGDERPYLADVLKSRCQKDKLKESLQHVKKPPHTQPKKI